MPGLTYPMPPTEQSSLLNGHRQQQPSFCQRIITLVEAEGEPSWLDSYRWFLFGSWLNLLLLLLVPVAATAHYANWDAPLRFGFSFVAIIPFVKLLGVATEQMSLSLRHTLVGLFIVLNSTSGNAVDIVVGFVALFKGEVRIVQTFMLGSILSDILLGLGCSFFAAGMFMRESWFEATTAKTSASLMTLASITLVIQAAYHASKHIISPVNGGAAVTTSGVLYTNLDESGQKGLLFISRGTAILLLAIYVAYLIFQLKMHASRNAALYLNPEDFLNESSSVMEEEVRNLRLPRMSVVAAGVSLPIVTIAMSPIVNYLVISIEETAARYSIPKLFVGLIFLPIIANAAKNVTLVQMAINDNMHHTVDICLGSSIQIATFIMPLLVVTGWCFGHEFTLLFKNFETIAFFVSVVFVNLLLQNGRSNYMKGLKLIILYIIISMVFWVS